MCPFVTDGILAVCITLSSRPPKTPIHWRQVTAPYHPHKHMLQLRQHGFRLTLKRAGFRGQMVYVPPPFKRSFGCDRWLTYVCPARRKAEFEIRYVFDRPGGIWMHSGIIILIVSCESSVRMPWNSPIIKLVSE